MLAGSHRSWSNAEHRRISSTIWSPENGGSCSRRLVFNRTIPLFGPELFCIPLGTRLTKLCQRFKSLGAEAFAYMDDVCVAFIDLTAAVIEAVSFLKCKDRHCQQGNKVRAAAAARTRPNARNNPPPTGRRRHRCPLRWGGGCRCPSGLECSRKRARRQGDH